MRYIATITVDGETWAVDMTGRSQGEIVRYMRAVRNTHAHGATVEFNYIRISE